MSDIPVYSDAEYEYTAGMDSTIIYDTRVPFEEQEYAGMVCVLPTGLAERDDSLHLELEIFVGSDAISRRQSWIIVPELFTSTGDSSRVFPAVVINGKIKQRHHTRRTRVQRDYSPDRPYVRMEARERYDTVFHYAVSVPYCMWMDTASLRLRQELRSPGDEVRLFISGGTGTVALTPHEPYQINPLVNFVEPDRESKQRKVQGQAFLDFQAGRSVIIPTFRRNPEELEKIAEIVNKVKNDPDVRITGLYIEGYASPEGGYSLNERLSLERALALKDHMRSTFGLDEELFRVSSVAEDWDGLRELIGQSNIPQKENIYRIIDSDSDFDWKEQRLKSLGGPWRTMLSEMFPQLRRVEYQIDFAVNDFTVEESRELAGRNPELLSQRELFLVAQSYEPGSPERDEVFELIFRLYPDEKIALVNSAATLLERGEDNTAKRYLDRLGEDPFAYNNMGIWYLKTGDLDRAEELLLAALDAGIPEAAHNLEELQRKRDDDKIMERYRR